MAGLAVLLVGVTVAVGFWGFSYDDNFITYRYARHWMEGGGLVYNPGERVLGTSAPGYALLLGTLAAVTTPLGLDIPGWGTLLAVLSLLTLTGLLYRNVEVEGSRLLLPLAFASLALTLRLNIQLFGAETLLVAALVALAAHLLFVRKRPCMAGLVIFGAMFLRLDAGLAALVIGLVAWWRQRRPPWGYGLAGVLPLTAWLFFLYVYFGRFVPLTIEGKKALREVPYSLRQWQMLTATLPVASSLVLLTGALVGLWVGWRCGVWKRPLPLALALWLVGHELVYRMVGVWFAPWYHLALVQAVVMLYVCGAVFLARRLAPRQDLARAGVLLLCLAPLLLPSLSHLIRRWQRPPDPRYEVYAAAGRYIRHHVPPEDEVLALEIGVLGYEAERRILDVGALVSPHFTAAKLSGTRPQLVAELAPPWVVTIEGNRMIEDILARPDLRGRYQPVASFSHPDWGRTEVRLLQRRPP